MTRNIKAYNLIDPQTLSGAEYISKSVFIPASLFDIVINAKVAAGSIKVKSVLLSATEDFAKFDEVTDLNRFVANNSSLDADALEQTKITPELSTDATYISRVSFISPYAGKPYAKIKFELEAGANMNVCAMALVEMANSPVVQ